MIRHYTKLGCLLLVMAAASAHHAEAAAVGSAFTYQGKLTDNGAPANGVYDISFALMDAASAGAQIGATNLLDNVTVTQGLFTVQLNFGAAALHGGARWLAIGVRAGASGGAYTALTPRQPLTPAPQAVSLALPYNAAYSSGSDLFELDNTGSGGAMSLNAGAGDALMAFADAGGNALYGQTTGGGTAVYGYNLGTSGRAGFFRTESISNAANAIETQANGTGHAIKANARVGSAGYFENTSASNSTTTLRSETNGSALAFWSRTTGTGGAARVEIANASNSSAALDVRTSGTGLAGKFTGGGVEVGGELHAQIGTVLNRATPVGFGRFVPLGGSTSIQTSSGNISIAYQGSGVYRLLIVGEGDPDLWTVMTSVSYNSQNDSIVYVAKAGQPLSVAGQPGNGVVYIKDVCTGGCDEFEPQHFINFVIYKGV
jgi:hypothetical protein